jgi:hypothetical protein
MLPPEETEHDTRKKAKVTGQVRVAKYYPGKPQPTTPGFRNILIHTSPSGLGGPLSPYVLKNEQGQLLENVWQFSKRYARVTQQKVYVNRYRQDKIIWEHPAEEHRDPESGEPNAAYWTWREKGMNNPYAVRYPNGFDGRHSCLCAVWQNKRLDYIEARKQIYCAEYARLAPLTQSFKTLQAMLERGENLQLLEVDGPDPTLTFAPYDQISVRAPGMLMNEDNIRLLVNDSRKPFGHGFVIAALLLGGDEWIK